MAVYITLSVLHGHTNIKPFFVSHCNFSTDWERIVYFKGVKNIVLSLFKATSWTRQYSPMIINKFTIMITVWRLDNYTELICDRYHAACNVELSIDTTNKRRIKNQLDATCYFIVLLIGSTCFGHSNTRNMFSP